MVFLLKQLTCTKTPALDWEQQNNSSGEEGVGAVALYSLLIHLAFPLFQFLWHRGSSRAGRWWEVLVLTSTVVIFDCPNATSSPLSLSLSVFPCGTLSVDFLEILSDPNIHTSSAVSTPPSLGNWLQPPAHTL